jgi:hypothetical protein
VLQLVLSGIGWSANAVAAARSPGDTRSNPYAQGDPGSMHGMHGM